MSHLSLLQQHVAFSGRILELLSKKGILSEEDPRANLGAAAPLLPLPDLCVSDFRLQLHSRSLNESLIEGLCELFQTRCSLWRETVQAEWSKSYGRLVALGRQARTLRLLEGACVANFSRRVQSMQDHILQLVDQRIEEYRADSGAAASASSSDEFSDTDFENGRGHKAEAIAILEAAYAYTTNITQAEKRRLAQATGLEPRQVVIWFQNRRNRKVKSRAEVAAPDTSVQQASSYTEPTRKRKKSCSDGAGPRRPSTFVTPEKRNRLQDMPPPPVDRCLWSGTSRVSLGSSTDSKADSLLSGWAGSERYGQQRTASSDSAATSYTSPSICNSFASTPASEECSTSTRVIAQEARHERPVSLSSKLEQASVEHRLLASPAHGLREAPPVEIAHIFNDGQQYLASSGSWGSPAGNLLFSDDCDVPRLDFDDLGINLADFGKEASLPFDFAAPPPAGGAQLWQRGAATSEAPIGPMYSQDPFAVTTANALKCRAAHASSMQDSRYTRPRHITEVAETLGDRDFQLFAILASHPTFQGMSPEAIVHFAASGGQDLSAEGEQMRSARSPSVLDSSTDSSFPREKAVVTPPSRVAEANSPEEFAFTFDLAELGLDRAFDEIRQSYRVAEEEAKMYSISEVEDEEGGGATSGSETGPEEMRGQRSKRDSCSTIGPERDTPSGIASGPWAIPARPVDLHGQRQTARYITS